MMALRRTTRRAVRTGCRAINLSSSAEWKLAPVLRGWRSCSQHNGAGGSLTRPWDLLNGANRQLSPAPLSHAQPSSHRMGSRSVCVLAASSHDWRCVSDEPICMRRAEPRLGSVLLALPHKRLYGWRVVGDKFANYSWIWIRFSYASHLGTKTWPPSRYLIAPLDHTVRALISHSYSTFECEMEPPAWLKLRISDVDMSH